MHQTYPEMEATKLTIVVYVLYRVYEDWSLNSKFGTYYWPLLNLAVPYHVHALFPFNFMSPCLYTECHTLCQYRKLQSQASWTLALSSQTASSFLSSPGTLSSALALRCEIEKKAEITLFLGIMIYDPMTIYQNCTKL